MTNTPFAHKKSLGQNFLVNARVLERIAAAGELDPSDTVLEIGAGQGVLTRLLLASPCRCVHSVEIDRRLEPWLAPLEANSGGRLRVVWANALDCGFGALEPLPTKVVANIPYNITTDLIWKVLEELAPRGLRRLVLLIQKEAAARLRAPARTKQRGPLGVTLEVMGTIESVMHVSPGSFSPPPKVASEVLRVTLGAHSDLAAAPAWRSLMTAAFAQRRKMLMGNLLALGCERALTETAFHAAGLNENARAEELTGPQWLALLRVLGSEIAEVRD